MNRFLFAFICCYVSFVQSSGAFTFREGSTYVLFSGYSSFEGICLQGSRGYYSDNSPVYTYQPRTKGTHNQEWILERASAADTLSFYIINAGTGKYLGGTKEIGKYSLPRNADKANAQIWTITPITDDQVLISCTDPYGVRRFLHATDTTSVSYPSIKSILHLNRNTRFAWIVTPTGEGLDGIRPVSPSSIQISVKDGRIVAEGIDRYVIYRTDGSPVSRNSRLQPGTYIVSTSQGSIKIAVP